MSSLNLSKYDFPSNVTPGSWGRLELQSREREFSLKWSSFFHLIGSLRTNCWLFLSIIFCSTLLQAAWFISKLFCSIPPCLEISGIFWKLSLLPVPAFLKNRQQVPVPMISVLGVYCGLMWLKRYFFTCWHEEGWAVFDREVQPPPPPPPSMATNPANQDYMSPQPTKKKPPPKPKPYAASRSVKQELPAVSESKMSVFF